MSLHAQIKKLLDDAAQSGTTTRADLAHQIIKVMRHNGCTFPECQCNLENNGRHECRRHK